MIANLPRIVELKNRYKNAPSRAHAYAPKHRRGLLAKHFCVFPPRGTVADCASRTRYRVFIDESISFGALGHNGRGICESAAGPPLCCHSCLAAARRIPRGPQRAVPLHALRHVVCCTLHVAWAGLAHRARHTLGRRHRRGRVHLSIDGQCTRVDRRLLCRLIRSTPTRISNTTNPNSLMTHSGALWCAGCTASHDGLSTDVCTAPFDRRMQTVHADRAAVDAVGVCIVRFGQVVDHQRLSGSGYVYSASLPPFNAVASICALEMVAPPSYTAREDTEWSERAQPHLYRNISICKSVRLCALSRLSCQMKTGEAKHATLHANSRAIHAALQALVSAPIDALNPRRKLQRVRLVSARSLSAETRPTVHQHLRCGTRPLAPKATAQRTGATGQAGTGAQDLQVQVKEFSTYIEFVGEAPSPIYHIRLAMCAGTRDRFVCCGASKPISGCSHGYGSHFRASPTRTYMNS